MHRKNITIKEHYSDRPVSARFIACLLTMLAIIVLVLGIVFSIKEGNPAYAICGFFVAWIAVS